ncbi:MAG: cupredoxin domain-containing protein [Candidatus Limnocylindria bacterium]
MARIILFGSAVIGVLVVTLAYAIWSGQYQAAQPSPSAAASGSGAPAGSATAPASAAASPSAAASASAQAQPSAAASGGAVMVEIKNLDFGADLTIAAGTTVTWMNSDVVPHTATQGSNGVKAPDALFDLQLPVGASSSYTFSTPGTYQVTCTIHPPMNMTITVQ